MGWQGGSPRCELSELVTRITGACPHSREWGGRGTAKAADCCSRMWLRLASSTTWPASAGRTQRQCPGLRKEVTHCEPEETSASCLGSDLLWADKMAPQWAERLSPSKSIARINFWAKGRNQNLVLNKGRMFNFCFSAWLWTFETKTSNFPTKQKTAFKQNLMRSCISLTFTYFFLILKIVYVWVFCLHAWSPRQLWDTRCALESEPSSSPRQQSVFWTAEPSLPDASLTSIDASIENWQMSQCKGR